MVSRNGEQIKWSIGAIFQNSLARGKGTLCILSNLAFWTLAYNLPRVELVETQSHDSGPESAQLHCTSPRKINVHVYLSCTSSCNVASSP